MKEDVYIINLKERIDKWEKISDQLKKSEILNPIRFEGIWEKPGWRGCAFSHLNLIKMAKDKGLEYIIVFEDDTEIISDNFDENFRELMVYLKEQKDWAIFNGNPSNMIAQRNQKIITLKKKPHVVSYERGQTTNFMIYSSRVYDKMLELYPLVVKGINNPSHMIDNFVTKLPCQKVTLIPYLTKQASGVSDIENRRVDYDKNILEWGEKFIQSRLL